jgi:hypothetical protein
MHQACAWVLVHVPGSNRPVRISGGNILTAPILPIGDFLDYPALNETVSLMTIRDRAQFSWSGQI